MPRPKLPRKVCFSPNVFYYKPQGVPLRNLQEICITREELEVLRLKNIERMNQRECAEAMHTSQSTVQRILQSACRKISQGIIEGKAIRIEKSI